MAGFKNNGLYLELVATPALPLSGHVTIFAATDGTINAIDELGNIVRLDDNGLYAIVAAISANYTTLSTTADVSAYLLSQIDGVASDLASEINARTAADSALHAETVTVSGNLQSEIIALSASAGGGAAALATTVADVSAFLQSEIVSVSGDLATEVAARIAGDTSLTNSLNLEISNRLAEDTVLESEIVGASGTLQFNITTVANNLATEITNRTAADDALQAEMVAVSGAIEADIAAEATARANADTAIWTAVDTVSGNLATEIASRIAGDASVTSFVNTVSGNLSTAIAGVDSNVTTLSNDLHTNYYDKTVSDGLFVHLTGAESISGNKTFVNNLVAGSDLTVNGNFFVSGTTTTVSSSNVVVEDNIITLNSGETGPGITLGDAGFTIDRGSLPNANLVFDESADRWVVSTGDTSAISGAHDTLAYVSEVNALRTDVMSTSAYLQSEITSLQISASGDLASFETTVAGLTAQLLSDINTEVSRAEGAESTLQSNIDTETTARIAGDNALQAEMVAVSGAIEADIATEAATRAAADVAVNSYVNAVSAALDLEINNRVSEDTAIVAEIISVSGYLQFEIDSINTNTSTIESEITTISGNLSAEIANRIAGDNSLTTLVNTASGNLAGSIAAEATARASADTTLQSNIDAEVSRAEAAEAALQAEMVAVSGAIEVDIASLESSLVPIVKGTIPCDTTNNIYTVTHPAVSGNAPVVSLEIPTGADAIFVQGVFNVTSTGFQIALSDVPSVSGYAINYMTTSNPGSVQIITAAGVAGTFTKVTTNSFGQVTNGTDAALSDLNGVYKVTASTTDATETEMFVEGISGSRMTVPLNKAWTFSALICGKRTDTTSVAAGYKIEGFIDNSFGTVDLFSSEMKSVFGEVDSVWDVNVYADNSNTALVFKVIGEAAANITWTAIVTIVEA